MTPSNGGLDSDGLIRVTTSDQILRLSADVDEVLVRSLTDEKLRDIASAVPGLRRLVTDGNNRVTDEGLRHLSVMIRLESLDLEWSGISDAGLEAIAAVSTLRWVDVGFCQGVTEAGVSRLRRLRPDLEVVFAEI
jgi:hypothetical protein